MRICPFVSHMLGDDNSNLLTIGGDRSDAGEPKSAPDVVILGYGPGAASQAETDNQGGNDAIASHLYCLREACRFYQEATSECRFDMMFSLLNDTKDGATPKGARDTSKTLAKNIDKVWKFQTKSVTEIVEAMSESDRRHESALKELRDEFEHLIEQRADTAALPEGLADKIDVLTRRIDNRDEGVDDLATTMSDVVINLNESIESLRKRAEEIVDRIGGIKQGSDEESIRAWLEETLSARIPDVSEMAVSVAALEARIESLVQDAQSHPDVDTRIKEALTIQQSMESRMRSWHDEILVNLKAFAEQQEQWRHRVDEMAEQYDRLSGYLEEGEKQRKRDQVRSGKKEARKFNNLGVTSFHNGAFEMAREQFMQAVKVDPEFSEAFNNLGLAYTELAQEDKASEAFRRAIEINPALHAAYNNLGYIFYRQGQYDQAIEMYNEALGRSTNNSSAYTNLGNAYYKLGRLEEARKAWSRALELDPANEKAKRNLDRLREEISR